jgi:thiol-disulfide isomerase/thioredoxin
MPNRHPAVTTAAFALLLALTAAACSGGGASPAAGTPGAPADSVAPESMAPAASSPPAGAPSPAASAPAESAPASSPPSTAAGPGPAAAALAERAWATAELTDVTTGEPFRIADLAGKTIFVESMAIWCTNCRQQQERFKEALAQLDPAEVAYVVLTVDPGESAEDLARYEADRGFTGQYAVAGTELSRALVADFGPNAINPPSVPLIHVTPGGEISFATGGESVDEILALARG